MTPRDRDRWLQAVLRSEMTDGAKLVAVRLMLHLNLATGRCDPSVDTVARGIGRDRTGVFRAIKALERGGWISRASTHGRHSNEYEFRIPDAEPSTVAPAPPLTVAPAPPLRHPNRGASATPTVAPAPLATVAPAPPKQGKENNEENIEERYEPEDALFDDFWRVYPKRVAKGAAQRAFRAALKQASPEEILAGAERYAGARAGLPARFTKHPATWLNGHCWLDEPDDAGKSTAERPEWIEGLAAFVNGERLQ